MKFGIKKTKYTSSIKNNGAFFISKPTINNQQSTINNQPLTINN